MKRNYLLLLLFIFICLQIAAQSRRMKVKFGDVKAEDFAPTLYPVDSNATAVYLFDVGSSDFVGDTRGELSVVYKRHARIRLLNKNAFDLATVEVPLYITTGYEQKFEKLEATVYNLENGNVVATKLDKNSFFKSKDGNVTTTKFTFPKLSEGCIIEYDYTINYPGYHYLPGWVFQGQYPRLYTEYEVTVPEFYDYAVLHQGYHPYYIDTSTISFDHYSISDASYSGTGSTSSFSVSANTVRTVWAMKDVPPLKNESFTTTLENYVAKVEFQFASLRYPNSEVKNFKRNWFELADELLKDEDFGQDLSHNNGWLDEVTDGMKQDKSDVDKAKHLYEYIRNNITCTDHDARYLSQPIKKTLQTKKGNVADINILLAATLMHAGLDAHPVLLSTRDNGKPSEIYPQVSKFNYVITALNLNEKQYLLDASVKELGFNHITPDCYNGYARTIDKDKPYIIDLSADSIKESKVTSVFIAQGSNNDMQVSSTSNVGYFESESIREKMNKITSEEFFKELKKTYVMDVDIKDGNIDSLKQLENPVSIKYTMKFNFGDDDIIYFNPMLAEQQKENPFTAAERHYPVEMSSCSDEIYILNMDVPKGYKVDEMPKSARVMLNENEGMFEYLIGKSGDHIQLRSHIQLKKATYEPEDYQTLRDFFGFIVKKQAEQIVFKKE